MNIFTEILLCVFLLSASFALVALGLAAINDASK